MAGTLDCPSVPGDLRSKSSVSAQLQPGPCGPVSALCRNLLVIAMLYFGLLGQQPLPNPRKETLSPVLSSLQLGKGSRNPGQKSEGIAAGREGGEGPPLDS